MTDIRNKLQLPLTTLLPINQSIFLRQSNPRSLTEPVPWRIGSCIIFACAKYSLFYWGLVCKIMPGWNRSAIRKRLTTPVFSKHSNRVKTLRDLAYLQIRWFFRAVRQIFHYFLFASCIRTISVCWCIQHIVIKTR